MSVLNVRPTRFNFQKPSREKNINISVFLCHLKRNAAFRDQQGTNCLLPLNSHLVLPFWVDKNIKIRYQHYLNIMAQAKPSTQFLSIFLLLAPLKETKWCEFSPMNDEMHCNEFTHTRWLSPSFGKFGCFSLSFSSCFRNYNVIWYPEVKILKGII